MGVAGYIKKAVLYVIAGVLFLTGVRLVSAQQEYTRPKTHLVQYGSSAGNPSPAYRWQQPDSSSR